MDDLEKIDRLFRLKERGALSDAEFQQEKARILGLDAGPTEQIIPPPSDVRKVYHDTRQGGYATGSGGKIAAIIITLSVAGLVFWAAKQGAWFSDAPNLPADEQARITEKTSITQSNETRSAMEETEPQALQWFLKEEDGGLEALFGLPSTGANFTLTCLDTEGNIEFNEYEIKRPSLPTGRVSNDQGQTFRYDGVFNEIEGLTSFGFKIPANNPLWQDVANGSSELRISPDGSEGFNLPRSPNLTAFVSKCLVRNE